MTKKMILVKVLNQMMKMQLIQCHLRRQWTQLNRMNIEQQQLRKTMNAMYHLNAPFINSVIWLVPPTAAPTSKRVNANAVQLTAPSISAECVARNRNDPKKKKKQLNKMEMNNPSSSSKQAQRHQKQRHRAFEQVRGEAVNENL